MKVQKAFLTILSFCLSIAPVAAFKSKPSKCFYKGSVPVGKHQKETSKVPIVYHPNYNITVTGLGWLLSKIHPFDSTKYGRVYDYLVNTVGISKKRFYKPYYNPCVDREKDLTAHRVDQDAFEMVHTKEYLQSLSISSVIAKICEIPPLALSFNWMLQSIILEPMRFASAGTVRAAFLALDDNGPGWAINLAGGYHHAKKNNGEGFCVYADIPLAIKKAFEWYKDTSLKVLIVDLDAHQGNGVEMVCGDKTIFGEKAIGGTDQSIAVFDIYNRSVYPCDDEAKQYIDFNHPVTSGINDLDYLSLLREELPKAIEQFKPDLIIYNAGTDIYEKDCLGQMSVSKAGIIERDEFVFTQALQNKCKIVMVPSGGYTNESAGIISKSIHNLIKKNIISVS